MTCPHITDRRRLRWTPGSMEPGTTRKACPICDLPDGPVRARCQAAMLDGRRRRLSVLAVGICRIHWVVSRWAA